MEVTYQFILGPVAVAGTIMVSRNKKGGITDPATKYKLFNPRLLAQFAGPYESNMEYMKFLEKRFSLNPEMNSDNIVEDIKWLTGLEELNAQEFMTKMIKLLKDGKRHAEGRMNANDSKKFEQEWDILMQHPFAIVMEKPITPEEQLKKNQNVTQIILTEASSRGFECNRMGLGDYLVNTKTIKGFNDVPQFEGMRADVEFQSKDKEPQVFVDTSKKMNKYIGEARNNSPYAVKILRNVINEHHYIYTTNAKPLYFLQTGPHTDWCWKPFED